MPRFHFNVHDGFVRPDRKGTELPNLKAARREALPLATELLEEDADRMSLGEAWYMEVTDHNDRILFRLEFRVGEDQPVPRQRV